MKAIEEQPQANLDVFGVHAVMGSAVDAGIIQSAELTRCYRHGVSQTAWFSLNRHTGSGAIYGSSGTCAVMRSPGIQTLC